MITIHLFSPQILTNHRLHTKLYIGAKQEYGSEQGGKTSALQELAYLMRGGTEDKQTEEEQRKEIIQTRTVFKNKCTCTDITESESGSDTA